MDTLGWIKLCGWDWAMWIDIGSGAMKIGKGGPVIVNQ